MCTNGLPYESHRRGEQIVAVDALAAGDRGHPRREILGRAFGDMAAVRRGGVFGMVVVDDLCQPRAAAEPKWCCAGVVAPAARSS
jgi:hypothetical protein